MRILISFLVYFVASVALAGPPIIFGGGGAKLLKDTIVNPDNMPLAFSSKRGFIQLEEFATNSNPDWLALSSSGHSRGLNTPLNDANHMGQVRYNTTTTADGYISLHFTVWNGFNGGGKQFWETSFYIEDLADATEDYDIYSGFYDSTVGDHTAIADGMYFRYDRDTEATNWDCVTVGGSTETVTDSGTAVVADEFVRFSIIEDPTAGNVVFKINGATVCTHTTNIPSGASELWYYIGNQISKEAGTTTRLFYADYYMYGFFSDSDR